MLLSFSFFKGGKIITLQSDFLWGYFLQISGLCVISANHWLRMCLNIEWLDLETVLKCFTELGFKIIKNNYLKRHPNDTKFTNHF